MLVVSDAGPLHYLILTGDIVLLPGLFERLSVPRIVIEELSSSEAPAPVRAWVAECPSWLDVRDAPDPENIAATRPRIDAGERAVIALSLAIGADLVLMDDRAGVTVARRHGLVATGTLGVLDLAARRGTIDLEQALGRLKTTSFYYRQGLFDALLARQRGPKPS
ncbi:MAG TPA: DUF3368 domain-containing protein [Stellaceae bacterium]|nr:DUF3368 domain-containing protein [Stellaceae bacterium]